MPQKRAPAPIAMPIDAGKGNGKSFADTRRVDRATPLEKPYMSGEDNQEVEGSL